MAAELHAHSMTLRGQRRRQMMESAIRPLDQVALLWVAFCKNKQAQSRGPAALVRNIQ